MLRPIDSATREVKSLDGLWRFALDDPSVPEPWKGLLPGELECPVPASYNDIFVPSLRKHLGKVWYQRSVHIPSTWTSDSRILIRVDAATHTGAVYVNDTFLASHVGGYLPFDAELTGAAGLNVKPGDEVRVTISVCNKLTNETIPPGRMVKTESGEDKMEYWHDFFNYAGLSRSVKMYSLPKTSIDDITLRNEIDGTTGVVKYEIEAGSGGAGGEVELQLLDREKRVVVSGSGTSGSLRVDNANLWQPGAAYLYTLIVRLRSASKVVDEYSLPVGIRTVRVEGVQVLINDKPTYFRGYGRHEDSAVRGKGHDPALMVHDFELMKWSGANSFRTSHYPYAEEVMDYADAHGWLVINETPAVGLNLGIMSGLAGGKKVHTFCPEFANDTTREAHAQVIRELIQRDKNRPGVVMWSITNEPDSGDDGAHAYFKPLCELARSLDDRPLTYANVMFVQPENEKIAALFDVIGLNRYYGWYKQIADLRSAEQCLEDELRDFSTVFNKPLLMMEYGTDTLQGLRSVNEATEPWSEDYQAAYYKMYHRVFDRIPALCGEQVWNFADFMTSPGIIRVNGNKKGVFARDRTPKNGAYVLKERWEGNGNDYPKGKVAKLGPARPKQNGAHKGNAGLSLLG